MRADQATTEFRELLQQIAEPVPFGSAVSEEFRRGYSAGRSDILAFIDTSVTAILAQMISETTAPQPHGKSQSL